MIDTVKKGFKERLDNNEWIDKETRQACVEKVDAITKLVAYPDELFNDTYLNGLYVNVSYKLNEVVYLIVLYHHIVQFFW